MEEPKEIRTGLYKIKEGCYLKEKSGLFNEPAIIYPMRDIETGKINWKNFFIGGSWSKFLMLVFVLIMLLFIVWAYRHDTATCVDIVKNPCKYCVIAYPAYSDNLINDSVVFQNLTDKLGGG